MNPCSPAAAGLINRALGNVFLSLPPLARLGHPRRLKAQVLNLRPLLYLFNREALREFLKHKTQVVVMLSHE